MKKNHKDYTVIPAKCSRTKKLFGIRGVRRDGVWHLTWAFKMTESQAKGEHIENNTLSGNAMFDATYPGCPHCGNRTIVLCGRCGHVSCAPIEQKDDVCTCSWCENKAKIEMSNDITGAKGGGF